MDKLEKALEKARQERGVGLASPSAGSLSATPLSSGREAYVAAAANLTPEFEAVLEKNRIVAHHARSPEADLFRILRTQILQTMAKANLRTLAITSPNYADGKTTIALNLAVSVALDLKQTVLLADLDLRKPSVHKYVGLEPQFGLTDYLAGHAALSDCLTRLPFDRLALLPAGRTVERSSEALGSPQMGRLAHELKSRYPDRLVIYDMPPLLEQDDPLAFLPHVDAVLLVVQDGVTRTAEVKRCLDILAPANVVGVVLNTILTKAPFV